MALSLNVAVCEDTCQDEENLLSILKKCSIPSVVTVFRSGEELLKAYEVNRFDLLLSDIYMRGISGIEAVTEIRKIDEDIPVAFITTSIDHTLESYRLAALKYIEKPFNQKDIEDILQLAKMKKDNAPSLFIQKNGSIDRIPLSQILFVEQRNHHIHINLAAGDFDEIYEKLSNVLPQLSENNFFQCHKSFIVNLNYVIDIDFELRCFVMKDGTNIPISREKMSKAKKEMESFLFERTRSL